jgi:hypothetical protein
MLPRLGLLLLLAGCAVDTGVMPSNRFIDRDIEATRRGEAEDLKDFRALSPGRPPPTRGANSYAPL